MKKQLVFLVLSFCALFAFAQQNQETRRTKSVLLFPEFREGKVVQSFGRFVTAKVNITLTEGKLCDIQEGKVREIDVTRIFSVEFPDAKFMKVPGGMMGEVVGQDGYNYLLKVTLIDKDRVRRETADGLEQKAFFVEGAMLDLEREGQSADEGYPLIDKYYFNIQGTVIPANESAFKKHVVPERKKEFKKLMNEHYWSWRDEDSLQKLFQFLKK